MLVKHHDAVRCGRGILGASKTEGPFTGVILRLCRHVGLYMGLGMGVQGLKLRVWGLELSGERWSHEGKRANYVEVQGRPNLLHSCYKASM